VFECAFYSRIQGCDERVEFGAINLGNGLDAFTLEPNQFIFVKQEAVTDPDRS
jgi:hypothetical protein